MKNQFIYNTSYPTLRLIECGKCGDIVNSADVVKHEAIHAKELNEGETLTFGCLPERNITPEIIFYLKHKIFLQMQRDKHLNPNVVQHD